MRDESSATTNGPKVSLASWFEVLHRATIDGRHCVDAAHPDR